MAARIIQLAGAAFNRILKGRSAPTVKAMPKGTKSNPYTDIKPFPKAPGAKINPNVKNKAGSTTGEKVDKRSKISAEEWAESGRWVAVKSSNVAGISYNSEARQLFIEFKGGAVYVYFGRDKAFAKSMFGCSSMGKFVWRNLRRKGVPYRRAN